MVYIIDSGQGALNIIRFLTEMKSNIKAQPFILRDHLGDKTNNEIKKIYAEYEIPNGSFLGCNSLNSVFREYPGSYNLLVEELNKSKSYDLILSTHRTRKNLQKDISRDDFEIQGLNVNYVELIDSGERLQLEVDDNGIDKIWLCCTHFDCFRIDTKKEIVSTSKMSANEIANNLG